MLSPTVIKAVAILALMAILSFGLHMLDKSRQKIGYDKAVAEYALKLQAAQDDAKAHEQAWQSQQLKQREKTNELLNARDRQYQSAANTIGGLRNTITNLGNGLSTITATACSARIEALSAVSNSCADALAEMAGHAEGQRIDALACRDQWPK